jgi:ATP-dependent DNA ligase
MEAATAATLPEGAGWQFEPKWDGFRALAFRDGDELFLQSKSGRPLNRYFPDVIGALAALGARRFVLDGEVAIPVAGQLSFAELQLRLHPAASRVRALAERHPAVFLPFDLLVTERRRSLVGDPLAIRRPRLERFAERYLAGFPHFLLTPATRDRPTAARWFDYSGGDLDGILAKRLDAAYLSGERTGMVKVKRIRSADCVVGGFRYGRGGREVGSLLLGLYDEAGLLHHVGFTSSLGREERRELTPRLEALRRRAGEDDGFTGNAPGGPSRWSRDRESEWEPLPARLVAEVAYDHFTGGRFRHGTRLLRFRPDKAPEQCTFDQVPTGARLGAVFPRLARS